MNIPIIRRCPLGMICEEVKDGAIIRCHLWNIVPGQNLQTGEIIDEWDCDFSWTRRLLLENSFSIRSVAAATESFRNEMKADNAIAIPLLKLNLE